MLSSSNNLLRTLGQKDFEALAPYLKVVRGEKGAVLHEQGDNVCFTYFPCGGSIVAFEVMVTDGKTVETSLIGREGAVGGIASQGYLPAYARVRVRFPGDFLKVEIAEIEKVKAHFPATAQLLARYSDCFLAQLIQSEACNAAHSVEQRTAKWLRFAVERTGIEEISLTQEELANMLGASRTYISRVIQRLKSLRILETHRGGLFVRDRIMLQELCCGCHDAICHHFETVLKGVYPGNEEALR